jgi:hypothetical protein
MDWHSLRHGLSGPVERKKELTAGPASLLMNPPRGRMLHIDGNTTLVVMSTV